MVTATNAVAGTSNGAHPLTKNAKRRLKKKQQSQAPPSAEGGSSNTPLKQEEDGAGPSSIIDEASTLHIDPDSSLYHAFSNVLSRYQPSSAPSQPSKGEVIYSDEEVESEHDSDSPTHDDAGLSKRKQKKLQRLTVAELKQLVRKPEVVEWTDVASSDPRLLVHLKCVRNSVPIPPHWSNKRDYLQNKRGIEKAPYVLPSYIADTGIATIKDALKEKEAESTLKQRTRERVQPKMGKMDIDYQKLHDAFFRFQHKPHLSAYGDTYYEGKEGETRYKDARPGVLSRDLVEALSIPPLAPPPWLIAMQRFGPPPSYPHLQIPGLNAPIPEGASWGFHPGGWGRPPVDENGQPLYGNVLASVGGEEWQGEVEKEHWGQLEAEESDPEEEEEEEEEEQQEEEEEVDPSGMQSSTSTVGAGLQTPSFIELRKDARLNPTPPDADSGGPRSLYQVLPERAPSSSSGQFLASERVYDMPSTHAPVLGSEARGTKRSADAVEMSINPDELEHGVTDKGGLGKRYDQERRDKAKARFGYGGDEEGVAEVREELTRERRREEERRAKGRH